MSTTHTPSTSPLPVDPYQWRHLPINFALLVASWAALLAWLLGGSEGAGNLFAAWTWFQVVVFTLVAVVKTVRLPVGAPAGVRYFFRFNSWLQLGVLAWFGCWWLLAANLWSLAMVAAQRHYLDKRIAEQAATA